MDKIIITVKRSKTGKKVFGVIVSLALLAGLCLTASTPVMAAATWHVDDSNAGAEDGSAAHPYNTIGEAITAASAGDTIIVAEGTYTETVAVSKQLKITTAYQAWVVDFILSNTSGVVIDGFLFNGGIVLTNCQSCVITNNCRDQVNANIRLNQSHGNVIAENSCNYILINGANGNTVTKNTFNGSGIATYSIALANSHANTFSGNVLSNATYGVGIQASDRNIFTCNSISSGIGTGIRMISGSHNAFIYNTLSNCHKGVVSNVSDSASIYFRYNNITNNGIFGVENTGTGTLNASYNYWSGNLANTSGDVTTGNPADTAYVYTYPHAGMVTTTSVTTEVETTTTAIETVETTETAFAVTTGVITNTESITFTTTDTVTLLVPTTVTETQSLTSTDTSTSMSTQTATVTDTQTAKFTVTVPQTINQTATTTLTLTDETTDWTVIISVSLGGLLTGGLIITIIVRRTQGAG